MVSVSAATLARRAGQALSRTPRAVFKAPLIPLASSILRPSSTPVSTRIGIRPSLRSYSAQTSDPSKLEVPEEPKEEEAANGSLDNKADKKAEVDLLAAKDKEIAQLKVH
jgi:hypothetical protein